MPAILTKWGGAVIFLKRVSSISHLIHQHHQLSTFPFPSLTRKCFSWLVHVTQDPDSHVAFGWWVLNLLIYGFSLCLFHLFLGVYLVRKPALWSCRVSHITCFAESIMFFDHLHVWSAGVSTKRTQMGSLVHPVHHWPVAFWVQEQQWSLPRSIVWQGGKMAKFWFCPSFHLLDFFPLKEDFSFFDCMIILGQCSLDVWFFPSYLPVFRIIISF